MYTWLVTVASRNMGPIIRCCDNAQNTPAFWEWRGSSNSAWMNEHSLFQRISIHLHYDVKASKHLASLLTTDVSGKRVAQPSLFIFIIFILPYIIFSCCQLPVCEFPKNTTTFHYRYDMQMYCTLVLLVNQHFPGLHSSGTHYTSVMLHCSLKGAASSIHIKR
jgi:hypothetical protein